MKATLAMTGTMKAGWSSTTSVLARLPLWRLAMAIGVILAAATALVVLLLGLVDQHVNVAQVLYATVLALVAFVGYAVSRQSVLNGSVVAGIAGLGLILVGEGMLALVAGVLMLLGAIWAFATSYRPTTAQSRTPGTP